MQLYKCHLVSQVILRQFSVGEKIKILDKSGGEKIDFIDQVAYIDLPKEDFDSVESRWARRIENKFGIVLQKYGQNPEAILSDDSAINTVKYLMALQFVRSAVGFSALVQNIRELELSLIENAPIELRPHIQTTWRRRIRTSAPSLIDGLINKCYSFLKENEIEIAIPLGGTNFIIGDVPIINYYKDEEKRTIKHVAIKVSEVFVLPISPRLAFSIAKKRGVWRLDTRAVRNLNKLVKKIALREFYALP